MESSWRFQAWQSSAWLDGVTLFARQRGTGPVYWITDRPGTPGYAVPYIWLGNNQLAVPVFDQQLPKLALHFPYGYDVLPD